MPQFPPFKNGINISLEAALRSNGVPKPREHCGTWYPAGAQPRAAPLPIAHGGLTEPLASPAGPGWRIGGAQEGKDPAQSLSSRRQDPTGPGPRAAGALTQVGVPLAVVACHVGAAASVPLADATLVQRVGGEEHAVTADGLQEGRWRGCWEGAEARAPGPPLPGRTGGRPAQGDRWYFCYNVEQPHIFQTRRPLAGRQACRTCRRGRGP